MIVVPQVDYWFPPGDKDRCGNTVGEGSAIAYTIFDLSWIAICLPSFDIFADIVGNSKNTDFIRTGYTIGDMYTLSMILLHETLHVLYPKYSKPNFLRLTVAILSYRLD